MQLFSKCRK